MPYTQLPLIVPRGAGEYPAWLYGGAPPSVAEDTSRIAAGSVRRSSSSMRALIGTYINREGGATRDEVEATLGLRHQTAGPRIRELVQLGAVVDSGQRRPTRSGRGAIVWRVA